MKTLTLLLSVILFISCNISTNEIIVEKTTEKEAAIAKFEEFGKRITKEGSISSTELMSKLEQEDSIYVKVNSKVEAVCKKKGCWMMVSLDEKNDMRVKFKDYDFFVPLNCENKNVTIEGWAFKDVTSVATLKHYALDGGASIQEIDAITEPEIGYNFVADGVLMN